MSVKIVGLNAFVKKLNKQPKAIEQAVDKEMERSALRVERSAKKLAPFDLGWLSNSIYFQQSGTNRFEIISPADYSIYQEYGTRYQPGKPFMFPSIKAEYPILMKNLNKLMRG